MKEHISNDSFVAIAWRGLCPNALSRYPAMRGWRACITLASELGVHEHTVGMWRRRFLKDRIKGLLDQARPGRPRKIDDDQVAAIIERALRSTPKDARHWSIRSMATEADHPRLSLTANSFFFRAFSR
jgi:hypothetical protein